MAKHKKLRSLQQFITENRIMVYTNQDGVIDHLDLRSLHTTDDVLTLLSEVPTLRRLSLQGTQITDNGVANLARLPGLEELDLRSCHGVSDAGMEHVSRLDKLKVLQLYDTGVGDKGLEFLGRVTDLQTIEIHSTKVTDAGLAQLQNFPRLRTLQVGGPIITDIGLGRVGQLQQLKWLEAADSPFTDAGLAQLGGLTQLTHLFIARTQIMGIGFKWLSALSNLESLHASGSKFSDDGLKQLAPFKRLKNLALDDTAVTDAGISHLKVLLALKDVGLERTRVTKDGKEKLKIALPRCVIHISAHPVPPSVERHDEEYFWLHPPRCISGFSARALRQERATTYELHCTCGSETGTVVGYPLSSYRKEFNGHQFVGPLALRCPKCGKKTQVIDTAEHGYDGECGSSVTIRGNGKPVDFRCPNCSSKEFRVTVHFEYDGGERDLKRDEPSIAVEDFFGSFSAVGSCVKCNDCVPVADFECG